MSNIEAAVFGAVDYCIFILMLCVSLAIGIYFGYFGKKLNTAQQYLSGGIQEIKLSTIAISLIASSMSASVLLIFPSEVYSYGISYMVSVGLAGATLISVAYIYIPLYYRTGVSHAYEYLERRFDWKVNKMASIFYILYTYSYSPVVLFLPSLAFSQVTGTNVHVINAVIGSICVIYTMIGGIKAVIWTDVVQALIMFLSVFAAAIYGVINVGGVDVVFKRSEEAGRLKIFDFDPDLTKRNSFWILLFNAISTYLGHFAFNQTVVQRLIALKSEQHAKRAIVLYCIGFMFLAVISLLTGMVIFANYYKCDPIRAKIISKVDKIMPYFVMNTIGHWTGMPGLFIAAMFSASLSTISAQMNSVSGILYNDYIRKLRLFKHTDFRARLIMKLIVLATGIFFILAGFIIDNFGQIFQISQIILSSTTGLTTGVFTLGMLTPWANKHGAFYGTIISGVISIWMIIGNLMALRSGSISYPPLPTSVEDCNLSENITLAINATLNSVSLTKGPGEPFILYRLSFLIFGMVATVCVWIFGLLISFMTGYTKPRDLDRNVLVSFMHWVLPKETTTTKRRATEIIEISNKEAENDLCVPLNK